MLGNYKEAFSSVEKGLVHFDGKVCSELEERLDKGDTIANYKKWRSVAMESTDTLIIRRKTNRKSVSQIIKTGKLADDKILEFWKKNFTGKKLRALIQRVKKIFKLGVIIPYSSSSEFFLFGERLLLLLDKISKKATLQLKQVKNQISERKFSERKGHLIQEILLKEMRRNELLEQLLDNNMFQVLKQGTTIKLFCTPYNVFPNIVNKKTLGKYDSISFKEFIHNDESKRQIIINEITLKHYTKVLQNKNHKLTVALDQIQIEEVNFTKGILESLELLYSCLSVPAKFKRESLLQKELPKGVSVKEGFKQGLLKQSKVVPITRNLVASRSTLPELSVALEIALLFHFIYNAFFSYGEILQDMVETNVNNDPYIKELSINNILQKDKLYPSNEYDGESFLVYEMKWDEVKQEVIYRRTNRLTLRKTEQLNILLSIKMLLPGALLKNKDFVVDNILESSTIQILEDRIKRWSLVRNDTKDIKNKKLSKNLKESNYRQMYDWINKIH